ncbi:MAG TPA: TIM44-like domain-containing protein [Burkholderiales bacterium]|nr:TIM44-like domain-containing protein [Burkholderiales bacterium]
MKNFRNARLSGFTLAASLAAVFFALTLVAHDADARRLGGAKTFGKQSSTVTQQQATSASKQTSAAPASSQPAQPPAPTPAPQPAGNRWLGPLAGVAAGLGIGALLSHFGIGGAFAEGLGSMIVIGLLLMAGVFIWRMLSRSTASSPASVRAMEPSYSTPAPQSQNSNREVSVLGTPLPALTPATAPAAAPWGVPADFDVTGFLRNGKVHFIRMQAAWDEKNLADIREFTTPEAFAEIKMQLDEEKGAVNKTDVVNLDAVLLGIETGPTDYLASVRFSGSMRENDQADETPFEEVWNLSKPVEGRGGWLLAGIQQLQ